MAIADANNSEDHKPDDLDKSSSHIWASLEAFENDDGLCIPQDPLEDLDFFPSFEHDFNSLPSIPITPQHENSHIFATEFPPLSELDSVGTISAPTMADQKEVEEINTEDDYKTSVSLNDDCSDHISSTYKGPKLEANNGVGVSVSELSFMAKKKRRSKRHWCTRSQTTTLPKRNCFLFSRPSPPKKRRCSHCLMEKTPQWRMGPLGPRTLCNACGVRYKSGRLLPEYRPAASPTFDCLKHSNYHRQIMKRKST